MRRAAALSEFLNAAESYLDEALGPPTGSAAERVGATKIFTALKTPASASGLPAQTQPAVACLDAALANAGTASPGVARIATAFGALAPSIHWRRREPAATDAAAFAIGHASAHIVGPFGLEQRNDVTIGASLLAPHVDYPDHRHPPEEIYVVLSEGEWRRDGRDWRRPGPGGLVYHEPNVTHAMRSGAAPLFAIWMLWT